MKFSIRFTASSQAKAPKGKIVSGNIAESGLLGPILRFQHLRMQSRDPAMLLHALFDPL